MLNANGPKPHFAPVLENESLYMTEYTNVPVPVDVNDMTDSKSSSRARLSTNTTRSFLAPCSVG